MAKGFLSKLFNQQDAAHAQAHAEYSADAENLRVGQGDIVQFAVNGCSVFARVIEPNGVEYDAHGTRYTGVLVKFSLWSCHQFRHVTIKRLISLDEVTAVIAAEAVYTAV